MAFDNETLKRVYDRTDGHCHLCRKRLAFTNYGQHGRRGAWEVDHSKPRGKGGSDHGNNLFAACTGCNRSKQDCSTTTARAVHGYRAAPLSARAKEKNAWTGGLLGGALAYILVPPQFRIAAALLTAVVGAAAGASYEPD